MTGLRRKFEQRLCRGELEGLTALSVAEADRLDLLDLAALSHALSGDRRRTLWAFEYAQGKELSPEQDAAICFAMGLAWTRASEYEKAKSTFARLRKFKRSDAAARFFCWQGLAFFHFFSGHHSRSVNYAELALKAAAQANNRFGILLAKELLAHSLIESGQTSLGLKYLEISYKLANEYGNKGLCATIRLNRLLYRAQFGLEPNAVRTLRDALEQLHPYESYSRNSLKLELANQLILRGRATEAHTVLEEACDSIYSSQNRRQIAMLNFRLSFLIFLGGSVENALHLLRSAEHHLNKMVDKKLLEKMKGLRAKIEGKYPSTWPRPQGQNIGEDRIGELCHAVRLREASITKRVMSEGYFYFLYELMGILPQDRTLAFDVVPKGIIILDRGDIEVVSTGFSNTLRKIVICLARGYVSKARLVEDVWGYEYDPLRHDPLVYTSISKLRIKLKSFGAWIESDQDGYRLSEKVKIIQSYTEAEESKELLPPPSALSSQNMGLSIRLLRLIAVIEDAKPGQTFDAPFVMRTFGVSRATATRDLNELVKRGLLRVTGKARATGYLKGDL
ncbi:MAG: hypothetical protein AB7F86_01810 [Bdellovibrionales bacterium]